MRVVRRAVHPRPRVVALPTSNLLRRPLAVAFIMGVLLTLCLHLAWGAAAKVIHGKATVTAAPAVTATAAMAAATPSWKTVLEPLNAGGWAFISDGPAENPSAVYASTHNVLHNGNVVTAWMRWEFSRPQAEVYPLHYLSAVTREELDCDARSYRRAAVIYYEQNNLQHKGPSFTALNDDTNWRLAIPGTEPDAMLNWGCSPPAVHAKSAPTKPHASGVVAQSSAPSSAPAAAPASQDLHTTR